MATAGLLAVLLASPLPHPRDPALSLLTAQIAVGAQGVRGAQRVRGLTMKQSLLLIGTVSSQFLSGNGRSTSSTQKLLDWHFFGVAFASVSRCRGPPNNK